jgi:hypothetical protein
MIQIDNKLVSLDLFEKKFVCNLDVCKGACCVHGDTGAPLEDEEREILENEYKNFKNMLSPQGRKTIEKEGKWVADGDGDWVTPLNKGKECAYTVFEKGIAKCSIELAWIRGTTCFQKPVSCHMYPIRVTKMGGHLALNYHSWNICRPALILGQKTGVPVYKFLKAPIIRAFGGDFYKELEVVDQALLKQQGSGKVDK